VATAFHTLRRLQITSLIYRTELKANQKRNVDIMHGRGNTAAHPAH